MTTIQERKMMMRVMIFAMVLTVLVALTVPAPAGDDRNLNIGDKAPTFALKNYDGAVISLERFSKRMHSQSSMEPSDLSGIDEERVGKAIRYLAFTDLSYAGAKADLEAAEIMRKRVRARIFLGADGTVAERQAEAEVHDETQAADGAYVQAIKAFEELRARRQRADLVVEVWRSLEASLRKAA